MNYTSVKNEIISILNMISGIGKVYASYKKTVDLKTVAQNNVKDGVFSLCFVNRISTTETDETGVGARDERDYALVKEINETWGISLYYAWKDSESLPSEFKFQELVDKIRNAFRWLNNLNDLAYKSYSVNFINTNLYETINDVLCHRADGRINIKYRAIGDDYEVGYSPNLLYAPEILIYRRGVDAVSDEGTEIDFLSVGTDEYDVLIVSCVNSAGESVGCEISEKSSTSFVAKSTEPATLTWILLTKQSIAGFQGAIFRDGVVDLIGDEWTVITFENTGINDYDIFTIESKNYKGETVSVEYRNYTESSFEARASENCRLKWMLLKLNV